MQEYIIRVELLSDMVFGSGSAVAGSVDLEVLHSKSGVPYMMGKTLKGKLREELRHVLKCKHTGIEQDKQVERILGSADDYDYATLKFTDLRLDSQVEALLDQIVSNSEIPVNEIDMLNAMTSVRNFTGINAATGVAEKGTLRKIQVINKGLIFYSSVVAQNALAPEDEAALAAAVASLRHLGSKETRGKGAVSCRLMKNGKDITVEGVQRFCEEVSE